MIEDIELNAGEKLKFQDSESIDDRFLKDWTALFARCYHVKEERALQIFQKYQINPARFAALYIDEKLVACYSGLKLDSSIGPVFLSTDTMSDGSRRKASVLLGEELYQRLAAEGVQAVVGYPNEKIIHLREKHLNWKLHGSLFLYFSLPLFWRFGYNRKLEEEELLWTLKRPEVGYFSKIPPFTRLVSRGKALGQGIGCALTLSAKSPGPFFFKVPEKLVAPKKFGFRVLSNKILEPELLKITEFLDLETIDVP